MTNCILKRALLLLGIMSSVSVSAQIKDDTIGGVIDGVRKYRELRADTDSILWEKDFKETSDVFINDDKQSFTFSEGQLDNDEDVIQGSSAIATSNDDYFLSEVGYLFSPMRFRVRAYENQYSSVYANGVLLNDAERGSFSYGMIGGLNDATRNKEGATYFENSSFGYNSIAGASNIDMRASHYAAGHKASLVGCNRNYIARAMYTYSTGLLNNGWAFTGSLSYRWANEGVIEGTFYNSLGYFLAAEKILNENHSLSLVTWGSPTERAQQGAATEEAYWLANSHYYNPNWGYHNGKKRNARVVTSYEPTALFTWDWKIDTDTKLTTSAVFKYSNYGTTALGWNGNAADPRPNYYKNLPSATYDMWNNTNPGKDLEALWQQSYDYWVSSKAHRQIKWDNLYYANYQANAIGQNAMYYVEERHNDQMMFNISSVLNHEFNLNHRITAGLHLGTTKGMHYKTLHDLLGAKNYGPDIDKFSVGDYSAQDNRVYNNLDNRDKVVGLGDRFGYDYNIYVNVARLFGDYTFSNKSVNVLVGAHVDATTMERYGNMRNGRAANSSKGSSGISLFLGGGIKAGVNWRIDGNNTLSAGVGLQESAPLAYNSYIAPRMRNETVAGLTNERIWTNELSYKMAYGPVTAKISGYYTAVYNAVQQSAFYNDNENQFTYLTMTGVDRRYFGGELALLYNITSSLSVGLIGSMGEAEYSNDANGFLISENETVAKNDKVYMKGAHVSGTPLTAVGLCADYNIDGWFLSANVNYYDRLYISASPYVRLEETMRINGQIEDGTATGQGLYINRPEQYKGKGGFMVDASIGKSIRLKGGKRLNINLMLQNILNNTNMVSGGYEQNRNDRYSDGEEKTYSFSKSPYLYYASAFNAYLNIGFRF